MIKKMGLNANRLVSRNFDIKKNLKVIKNIYSSCLKKKLIYIDYRTYFFCYFFMS